MGWGEQSPRLSNYEPQSPYLSLLGQYRTNKSGKIFGGHNHVQCMSLSLFFLRDTVHLGLNIPKVEASGQYVMEGRFAFVNLGKSAGKTRYVNNSPFSSKNVLVQI